MSTSPSIPRPPSRSERLLRDTLRRDDTLRTYAPHSSRPRSNSSNCDEDEDDNIFQSAILQRCSSRRDSAASVLGHHSTGYYVPGEDEHASYSRLLRSSSNSGSSRSGRSDRRSSPPRTAHMQEKSEEVARHHETAPHEAVLRSRLDSVIHSMRIDNHGDTVDSSTASLSSSLGSISNGRAHSPSSHHTQLTFPEPEPCVPSTSQRQESSHKPPRRTQTNARPTSPQRPSASPRSRRAPQTQRSPSQTPTSRGKEQPKRQQPDSPWMFVPLPQSPPTFSTSPSKRGGPALVTFVASPDPHTHMSTRSSPRHSPHSSSTFDPEAASHALKQLPGYVSFSSVAGLGAPPEEEERRNGHKPIPGFALLGGGNGRISSLGMGGGKWWIF